jgi:hypothetical protein
MIIDPNALCVYLYDSQVLKQTLSIDSVNPTNLELSFQLTSTAEFFKRKCADNFDRRRSRIAFHPDKPGGDSDKFIEIGQCESIEKRFPQDLLRNLHFVHDITKFRGNICPNLNMNILFFDLRQVDPPSVDSATTSFLEGESLRIEDKRSGGAESADGETRAEASLHGHTVRSLLAFV